MPDRAPRRSHWFTLLGIIIGVGAAGVGSSVWLRQQTPLQQVYFSQYLSTASAGFLPSTHLGAKPTQPYVALAAPGTQVAVNLDCPATGVLYLTQENSSLFPRYQAQAVACVVHAQPVAFHTWLKQSIYEKDCLDFITVPLQWAGGFLLACLVTGLLLDKQQFRRKLGDKVLRGPRLVSRFRYNRETKGDGFAIRLDNRRNVLEFFMTARNGKTVRIPRVNEHSHTLTMADPGGGKTSIFKQILDQVEARKETAIVYDPHGEYVKRYYRPTRNDLILNPLDLRCPSWSPAHELNLSDKGIAMAMAMAQAESLFPGNMKDRSWFFIHVSRLIWQYCMVNYQPTAHQMAELMANADPLIDIVVKGTELEAMMAANAAPQRAGVVSHLSMIADSLRQLPDVPIGGVPSFVIRDWCEHRTGWIFISNTIDTRTSLRPIQSMWLDLLIMRLMSQGPRPDLPKVLIAIDELQTLQQLPQLMPLMTEGRKTLRALIGFQGRSQIKDLYGEIAEAIFSAAFTKFFMRTSEVEAAKWISGMIGDVEKQRFRETVPAHAFSSKTGHSYSGPEQVVQPLLLFSEFQGLKDRVGYMKNGNMVVKFTISIVPDRFIAPAFLPREGMPVVRKELPDLAEIKAARQVKELQAQLEKQEKVSDRQAAKEERIAKQEQRAGQVLQMRLENQERARESQERARAAAARSEEKHRLWLAKQFGDGVPVLPDAETEQEEVNE